MGRTANAQVKFRPEFSADLADVVFEISHVRDDDESLTIDAENGREIIGVRTRNGKRWGYRTAYVTDLLTLDDQPFATKTESGMTFRTELLKGSETYIVTDACGEVYARAHCVNVPNRLYTMVVLGQFAGVAPEGNVVTALRAL